MHSPKAELVFFILSILILKDSFYLVYGLFNICEDWATGLAPVGVDQDLQRFPYKNLFRPIYPLDSSITNSDLGIFWIPSLEEV